MTPNNQELHRVVATVFIYKDGKYLLVKRSSHTKIFPDKWHVPGGGLATSDYINAKPDTSAGQWYYALTKGLFREVKEEVNLEIEEPKYLLDLAFIQPDGTPVLCLVYYARYKSGEVKLDADGVEFVWVSAVKAKRYDLIPGIEHEIEMVDEILCETN